MLIGLEDLIAAYPTQFSVGNPNCSDNPTTVSQSLIHSLGACTGLRPSDRPRCLRNLKRYVEAYPLLCYSLMVLQLVGFIASPNAQIRLLATENLVIYSTSQPDIFKVENLLPVKNLKLLVKDHPV